jgi:hypothetical protein
MQAKEGNCRSSPSASILCSVSYAVEYHLSHQDRHLLTSTPACMDVVLTEPEILNRSTLLRVSL